MTLERKSIEVIAADVPFGGDPMAAPTIYVDDIRGFINFGETVKMNFVEYRASPADGQILAIPVASVVMPASKVRDWANFFTTLADMGDAPVAAEDADAKPA